MATPESRPEVRRDPGKQLGDRDAGTAGADAGGSPGGARGEGAAKGATSVAQPALIDGQLPLTEPRCGGRLPGKGTGMCGLNLTCARWTQLAKDRASGRTDYVGVPVWWTCAKSKISMTLTGYVHDPATQAPLTDVAKVRPKTKQHPWKSGKKPQDLPVAKTRYEQNQRHRDRAARLAKERNA